MPKPNIVRDKSFAFAIRIINLTKYLHGTKKEFILSNQLLKSGTSIGANAHEAEHAQSRPDFISKLNIALKEATESQYWLSLLHRTDYLTEVEFESLYADCSELVALLVSSLKTLKENP